MGFALPSGLPVIQCGLAPDGCKVLELWEPQRRHAFGNILGSCGTIGHDKAGFYVGTTGILALATVPVAAWYVLGFNAAAPAWWKWLVDYFVAMHTLPPHFPEPRRFWAGGDHTRRDRHKPVPIRACRTHAISTATAPRGSVANF